MGDVTVNKIDITKNFNKEFKKDLKGQGSFIQYGFVLISLLF